MEIADCHVHMENGLDGYDLGVGFKNIIFNTVESYNEHQSKVSSSDAISLIFDYKNNLDFILQESSNIDAYKIHTRFQKIAVSDYETLTDKLKFADPNKPIILDAFYYGKEMPFQPNLTEFIRLIERFPERSFIIAHCGGYKVIEYFFHLREFSNVYYDLSLSLQYLADSSSITDLVKLIKFTPKDKIMFGSDYHFASPKTQFDFLVKICLDLNLSTEETQMICHDNTLRLFNPRM